MKRLGKTLVVFAGITLAGTACKEDPAELHRKKGNTHFAKDEFKEAAEAYALSLQADPKQEKLWERKAYAHMQLGEMDKVDESFVKLADFKAEPVQKAEVYRNLANIYVQRGPPEKAEQYFLEALKLNPKDDVTLAWLAEIFAQLGGARLPTAPAVPAHLEKAMAYYDQAIAAKPDAPNNYINKRIALIKLANHLEQEKSAAQQEAVEAKKDVVKAQEATLRAQELAARIEKFKAESTELMKKSAELQKAAKAAQATQAQ